MQIAARSPEKETRDAHLRALVEKAEAAHAALSPVDRAIAHARQRASYARGPVDVALVDPTVALADEVVRLRERIRRLEAIPAVAKTLRAEARRDMILDLWAQGVLGKEISARAGWKGENSITNFMVGARKAGDPRAVYRHKRVGK